MTKKRAITDKAKEERREAITICAKEIYLNKNYEEIKMADIASKAGLAKGTLFLYFATKEELFLEIVFQEYKGLLNSLKLYFTGKKISDPKILKEELMIFFKGVLTKNKRLLGLLAMLHVILEKNIQQDTAAVFKKTLYEDTLSTASAMADLFDNASPEFKRYNQMFWINFILEVHVLIVGIYNISEPSEIIKKVIEKENLVYFNVDFDLFFMNMLTALIDGSIF